MSYGGAFLDDQRCYRVPLVARGRLRAPIIVAKTPEDAAEKAAYLFGLDVAAVSTKAVTELHDVKRHQGGRRR